MPVEDTPLERRVLAHEQILQALMAQLAEGDPKFLDRLHDRFASVRRGAYEHDHVETADYAEAFLHEVARLVRTASAAQRPGTVEAASKAPSPAVREPVDDDTVVIHSVRTRGVWHVTRDGVFVGDYLAEFAARAAAADAAQAVERLGKRAEVQFGPHT